MQLSLLPHRIDHADLDIPFGWDAGLGKDGASVVDWKAFLAFVDVVDVVNQSVVDLLLSALQRDL